MMHEGPVIAEKYFGCATIKSECGVHELEGEDCSSPVVAVMGVRTHDEVGFFWFCEEHADKLDQEVDPDPLAPLVRVVRTCNHDADGHRCGAVATYVGLFGYRAGDAPYLGITSLCERHAQ
jgi:hypothetical protein